MTDVDPRTAGCPKKMHYGPCGGVDADGTCEVSTDRCVYVDPPTVPWHGLVPAGPGPVTRPMTTSATAMQETLRTRPVVVSDLPSRPLSAASIRECAQILRGHVDAVLLGDSGRSRVQFSPTYRAHLVRQHGLAVWAGLNCRDRNRVAIEGELAGLADVGVSAVHCVTGDHTLTGHRPDASPVFDVDSTQLAALARAAGHLVSVGESPTTPPVDKRAERLAVKVTAGAQVCFVNHAGGPDRVQEFVQRSRDLGVDVPYVACVPVVLDGGSAELLRTFTSLVLPDGFLESILDAQNPYTAGLSAAVALSEQLLAVDGVRGVNLSGGPALGGELAYAEALATVSDRLGLKSGG